MARQVKTQGAWLARMALRWSERFCLVLGVGALGWWALVAVNARRTQASLSHSLQMARQEIPAVPRQPFAARQPAPPNSLVGRIDIARIGLSAIVLEGDGAQTLSTAVGHIPGTALPGDSGNVGLAGHRDTFFRALKRIRRGDEIMVTTLHGCYRYRVVSLEIVDPDQTRVLQPSSTPSVTLVTCYPFHFIGSAPMRFVVHAGMVPG